MYILETEQAFDSAHFLNGYEGKCRNLHGHRWRIVARIAADSLSTERQTRDMVIDFGDFKDALKELTEELDHCLIIETDSLKPKTLEALREEDFRSGLQGGSGFFSPSRPCRERIFGLPVLQGMRTENEKAHRHRFFFQYEGRGLSGLRRNGGDSVPQPGCSR